jgi:hypothetical protein
METKKVDSLKKPLLCMDYMSEEDDEKRNTAKRSKVSPGSNLEEEKGPSRTISPSKEPDTIMSSSEIQTSWFRRLWHKIIRKKIQDEITEA